MAEHLTIEVVHVLPERVFSRTLALPDGATVEDALEASAVFTAFPEQAQSPQVGIHSRRVTLDQPLRDGDRVELYRALQIDPKVARRRRAVRGGR